MVWMLSIAKFESVRAKIPLLITFFSVYFFRNICKVREYQEKWSKIHANIKRVITMLFLVPWTADDKDFTLVHPFLSTLNLKKVVICIKWKNFQYFIEGSNRWSLLTDFFSSLKLDFNKRIFQPSALSKMAKFGKIVQHRHKIGINWSAKVEKSVPKMLDSSTFSYFSLCV